MTYKINSRMKSHPCIPPPWLERVYNVYTRTGQEYKYLYPAVIYSVGSTMRGRRINEKGTGSDPASDITEYSLGDQIIDLPPSVVGPQYAGAATEKMKWHPTNRTVVTKDGKLRSLYSAVNGPGLRIKRMRKGPGGRMVASYVLP